MCSCLTCCVAARRSYIVIWQSYTMRIDDSLMQGSTQCVIQEQCHQTAQVRNEVLVICNALQELKSQPGKWTHALTCQLAPRQQGLKVSFALPVAVCCLMVEFSDLHESVHEASMETMQCPRYVTFLRIGLYK